MKRCPICEFVYEDDQLLCEMDGMELVSTDGLFPAEHEQQTKPIRSPRKRSSLIALFAVLILGSLAFIFYQPFRPHSTSTTGDQSSANSTGTLIAEPGAPAPSPVDTASPSSSSSLSESPVSPTSKQEEANQPSRNNRVSPSVSSRVSARQKQRSKPTRANQE